MSEFETYWNDFVSIHEQTEPVQRMFQRQRERNRKMYTDEGERFEDTGQPYTKKVPPTGVSAPPIGEATEPESVDLSDFTVHEMLNRKIWNSDDKIDPAIRDRMLQIAQDFYEKLGIKAEILDITLTGSLANYNWSKFSDLDVHIVLNYQDVDENMELVRELFQQTKSNWNRQHDIRVKGHEVELYVQDVNDPHFSSGVYSLLSGEWVVKPRREDKEIDREAVKKKAASTMDMIDDVQKLFDEGDYQEALEYGERVRDKIKRFRASGLEREGEYSFENLAFKVLRRNDYLERLSKLRVDTYDSQMSMAQQ